MAEFQQRNFQGQRRDGGGYGSQAPQPTISVEEIKFKPLPAELFSDIAEDKARAIAVAGGGRKNKSTQLRKFYDELVMWHEKVQLAEKRDEKYAELAPFIKMLNAKVAYAKGRDHVDECFERMFSHVIKSISDAESLKHAKLFMEAFMGYYKAQEK